MGAVRHNLHLNNARLRDRESAGHPAHLSQQPLITSSEGTMLTVTWACPKGTAQGLHWGNCKQPRVALRPRLGACSSIGQRYSLQTGCSSVADASRSLRLVTRCEREKSWGEIASEFGDAVKDVGQKLAKPFKKDAELQQRKQEEKTLKKNISDALGGGLVGNLVGGMLGSVVGMAAQTFKEGLQTSQAVYERAQKEIKLDKRVEDFIGMRWSPKYGRPGYSLTGCCVPFRYRNRCLPDNVAAVQLDEYKRTTEHNREDRLPSAGQYRQCQRQRDRCERRFDHRAHKVRRSSSQLVKRQGVCCRRRRRH
eukprot:scaffold1851_cov390-Prasinococcus_capsulatus_cf.AAC.3